MSLATCSARSLKPGGLSNWGNEGTGNVKFSLVVLKTRRVESLRRFYGSLDIELAEEPGEGEDDHHPS
jgi:hypothetical protein